jgi:protein subunit release factor B
MFSSGLTRMMAHNVIPLRAHPLLASSFQFLSSKSNKPTIQEKDLEEKFIRSSGPGGQSVNKVNSKVQLRHIPSGIMVSCQQERSLAVNRKIARRILRDKLDMEINGDLSKIGKRIARIKRRKAQAKRRSNRKYHGDSDKVKGYDDEESLRPPLSIAEGVPWTTPYRKQK